METIIICGGAKKPAIDRIDLLVKGDSITFIGVDRGCVELINAGYHLDYAIGDFDSVSEEEKSFIYANSDAMLIYPQNKDDTDMELALELVIDKLPNYKQLIILGAIGEKKGRLDHFIANLWMVYQPRFKSIISKLVFVEKNHLLKFYWPGIYQIAASQKTEYLSIIGLTPIANLSISGAVYELEGVDINYPRAFISNEFIELKSKVEVSFDQGLLLVILVEVR